MAKGIGLIGSINGKVGNMVGYSLKDSNNKQTQGVRVHQPVVKNPKTYAQAEQRCIYIPLMTLYRKIRQIILRGQEATPYGNASRNLWLSKVMGNYKDGWFNRGADIIAPPLVQLTSGTINFKPNIDLNFTVCALKYSRTLPTPPATIADVSAIILESYPGLREGDQLTMIAFHDYMNKNSVLIYSFILDLSNTNATPVWMNASTSFLSIKYDGIFQTAGAFVASRKKANGGHLRSNAFITPTNHYPTSVLGDAAKQAAAESYMSGSVNTDWAEESIQE